MKFGKQLQLSSYPPWRDFYISYDRLKRVITRRRFLADKLKSTPRSSPSSTPRSVQMMNLHGSKNNKVDEMTPLASPLGSEQANNKTPAEEESAEFFPLILAEIDKINKFFVGKLAYLRIALEEITDKRGNNYQSHHTGGGGDHSDFIRLRDIYVELAALRSYCK